MTYDELRSGVDGRPLELRMLHVERGGPLKDISRAALKVVFPRVPSRGAVRHRQVVLFGMMESGKTSLMQYLAFKGLETYGEENVNLIAVRSLQEALEAIDGRPVQLIFVDDAVRAANSRQSMKSAEDVADFYEVRHIYEKRTSTDRGVVIMVWASQRYRSLDIVYRGSAHCFLFKTSAVDPDDEKQIRKLLPDHAVSELEAITARIYEEADDDIKGTCVAYLPTSRRTGFFHSDYVHGPLDFDGEKGVIDPVEPFSFDVERELVRMMDDRAWKREARAYYLSRVEGMSQRDIAKDPLIKRDQSNVSRLVAKAKGEISRKAGAAYEMWKLEELLRRGYDAKRLGGRGQPDIVAERDEKRYVHSCKCMDFSRRRTLPVNELRPEIRCAIKEDRELVLSVFNLHDGTEREIRLNATSIGDSVVIEAHNER